MGSSFHHLTCCGGHLRHSHHHISAELTSSSTRAFKGHFATIPFLHNPVRHSLLSYSATRRRKNKQAPQWRCCEAGTAGAPFPLDTKESEPAGDSFKHGAYATRPLDREATDPLVHIPVERDSATTESVSAVDCMPSERGQRADDSLVHGGTSQEGLQSLQQEDQFGKGLLQQMRDIIFFAGPALGIWLSGPLMSLIDTAVVGNSSSLELAALGPGTVFCDQVGYVFMFLSVATSNLIATSLAKQSKEEAAHHLSRLLFVGLAAGIGMLVLTRAFCSPLLKAFVGPQNASMVSAAGSYVQIRGLAWPIVLVGLVAQSASLGMQDSWSPLKVLAVASFVNASGDILLCSVFKYGIAGAAWATTISQYIGGYLMLRSLNAKGYNGLALAVPSFKELVYMINLAGPVLLTMLSKVLFYSFATYLSTSLGTVTLAAHQVMLGLYATCSVAAEPLAQTAQSFMPSLIQGPTRNLRKAQTLLRSLLLIGAVSGLLLACFGMCFPWFLPQLFTNDRAVVSQMRTVSMPLFWGLVASPPLLSLEGTLLAGRDLKFLSLSMVLCFLCGSTLLMTCTKVGFGLLGIWCTMALFQTIRFFLAFSRLTSENSFLRDSATTQQLSPI